MWVRQFTEVRRDGVVVAMPAVLKIEKHMKPADISSARRAMYLESYEHDQRLVRRRRLVRYGLPLIVFTSFVLGFAVGRVF